MLQIWSLVIRLFVGLKLERHLFNFKRMYVIQIHNIWFLSKDIKLVNWEYVIRQQKSSSKLFVVSTYNISGNHIWYWSFPYLIHHIYFIYFSIPVPSFILLRTEDPQMTPCVLAWAITICQPHNKGTHESHTAVHTIPRLRGQPLQSTPPCSP